MTQSRTVSFHAADTSRLHNSRLANVLRPGVYSGFKLRPNAASANKLDITTGDDTASVLLTSEGVRIEESTDLYGAVAVANADPNLTRVDLVVAEYQFTTDTAVAAQYKIIRGAYPSSPTADLVFPEPANAYQVPIAFVVVQPQAASGGATRAVIAITDILHIGRAADVRAPEGISSFMPIVSPADRRRLFVHAGILPNFDGTRALVFNGGYSDVIDYTTHTEGEVKYYLFGVDDDGAVRVIGSASTVAALPDFSRDVFPVCYVTGTRVPSTDAVTLTDVVDLRFPFARQLSPVLEEEPYKAALADSVFRYLRVESFTSLDRINAASLSDATVTLDVDRGLTAMTLTGEPTDDVTIATTDLLTGTAIGNVKHFMVVVDANFEGLTIKFSTTSSTGGFVAARYRSGEVVRIPAGGGGRLFLQFTVPAEAVAAGAAIFSYGCFMTLDESVVSAGTVADIGLDALKNAVTNLIANGNFRYWSRDDINGDPTDPDAFAEIAYAASEDQPFAADGWQFTSFTFPANDGSVRRRGLSRDIIETGEENVSDTCLYWAGSAGAAGSLGTNTLEYRTPVPPGSSGQRITFACSFRASAAAVVRIGIVMYEVTEQKTLVIQSAPTEVSPASSRGDLIVTSDVAVNNRTVAVGFRIYLGQTTGESWAALWNARAAVGSFRQLAYTEAPNATDLLRKYYERGRVFVAGNMLEGQTIGTAVQFGAKKHTVFGDVEAQVIAQSDSNRSLNIDASAYAATADGVVVTSQVLASGAVRIDEDFEAFVRYASA